MSLSKSNNPAAYVPNSPDDFIGPARTIALMLEAKAKALLSAKNPAPVKMLLYGSPGVGKSELVKFFANRLAWHPTAIEDTNGRNVTIDVVRRWQESAHYIPIGGQFVIKTVQELDTAPPASQDLLLHYLDAMKPGMVFLGTSNLQLQMLSERFETRLQQFKVNAPSTDEIAKFLTKRWGFPKQRALEIAVGSGSNVRGALLDAQSILDVQRIAA
jgi:replication-associated recombination protein RarA